MQFHLSIGVSQFQAQRFNLHHDLRQLIPPKKHQQHLAPGTGLRAIRFPGTGLFRTSAERPESTPRDPVKLWHTSRDGFRVRILVSAFFSQRVRNQSLRMPGRPGGIFSRPRRDRLEPVYPAFVPKQSTADNKLGARSANMGCACVRKGNLRVPNLNNPKWSNGFSFRGPGILWDILSQAQVPNISHRCGV